MCIDYGDQSMTVFIALLRAINVGGTGILPMKELSGLCTDLGFESVRTYIQSGNVIFQSRRSEERIRTELEQALAGKMGKRIDVMVRTAPELRSVLEANPFPDADPGQVDVAFLAGPVPVGLLEKFRIAGREEIRLGTREIYIHYPDGMGRSKLKLPSGVSATVRNHQHRRQAHRHDEDVVSADRAGNRNGGGHNPDLSVIPLTSLLFTKLHHAFKYFGERG